MSSLSLKIPWPLQSWPSNLDRLVQQGEQGIINHEVYKKISSIQYLALRKAVNIPKAISSMSILVVKKEKDSKPLRAKSHIFVLGNFKDRLYRKSQRYAPVIKYSSLRLLIAKSVQEKHVLQQGDFKNAFCNATLLKNEVTVIRPPIGHPDFQDD